MGGGASPGQGGGYGNGNGNGYGKSPLPLKRLQRQSADCFSGGGPSSAGSPGYGGMGGGNGYGELTQPFALHQAWFGEAKDVRQVEASLEDHQDTAVAAVMGTATAMVRWCLPLVQRDDSMADRSPGGVPPAGLGPTAGGGYGK